MQQLEQGDAARAVVERGVDVSKYQGRIDWRRVAAAGYRFAFVRTGWAGYAGGIVSAAVDGIRCAEKILEHS